MPTTSNFGWTTPADTDYVKDGALAIRTLANGIDTSLVDLKGGTTGQILSKNSNTDLDYTWINNDQGDITNIAVTSPITGGGASGSVTIGIQDGTTAQKGAVQLENSTSSTSTTTAAVPASVKSAYDLANGAIAKTLIDAEGDLIVGDASDAVQRLAIGTNGQVLTVDTSVDGKIKWGSVSSGLTLITKSTFSGASSHSINDCFSSTYDFYEVKIAFTAGTGAPDFTIRLRAAGTDDTADYAGTTIYAFGATIGSNDNNVAGTDEFFVAGSGNNTAQFTAIHARICNPYKSQVTTLFADSSYGTSNVFNFQNIGYHNDTGSFDGFTLRASTGTMTGTIYVYGLAV